MGIFKYSNSLEIVWTYKVRVINVASYQDPSSKTLYLECTCLVLLLLFMNFLIFLKAWYVRRSFEKQSDGSVVRRPLSRHESITNVIMSRFESGRQMNENDDRNIVRRLHRSLSTGISARFKSGSEEAAITEDNRADTIPPRGAIDNSLRVHAMKRLQSSNVLTWK